MIRRVITAAMACAAFVATAGAQDESSFKMYGFMDASYFQFWIPENGLLNKEGFDDKAHFGVDNVNLYTSFTPNSRVKSLVEIAYHNKPVSLDKGSVGTIIRIDPQDVEVVQEEPRAAASNKVNMGSFNTEYGDIAVERAHIDVKFNQYVNLRAGKFITPYGIWNVDHGSPVLLTIRQPYEVGLVEVFPKSQIGLSENGKVFMGDADLDYTLYLSSGRNASGIKKISDLGAGGNLSLSLPVASGMTIGASAFTGIQSGANRSMVITLGQADYNNLIAASTAQFLPDTTALLMEALGMGMTDSATIQGYISSTIQSRVANDVANNRIPAWFASEDGGLNPDNYSFRDSVKYRSREMCFSGDFRIKVKDFSFQSEINYQLLKNHLKYTDKSTSVLGWYVLGSYAFPLSENLTITPYCMFEQIKSRGQNYNPSTQMFSVNIPGFQVLAAGLNFRVFQNVLTKVEYSNVKMFGGPLYDDNKDALKGNALSVQFSVGF